MSAESPTHWIRDLALAPAGEEKIRIAREDMPALNALVERHRVTQPFRDSRIAVCVIPTPETGNLVWALKQLGAGVTLCSDNVISVDDDVAAAVASWGISVFGKRDQSREEFFQCIRWATNFCGPQGEILPPTQIIDDGADMTQLIHQEKVGWLQQLLVITEQTTCGINFDNGLVRRGELMVPVVDINTGLKASFDNRFGPRESFITAFKACKDIQLGGRVAVVAGFGMVGKGVAEALQMAGCRIIITESDPIKAVEALMSGYRVATVDEALTEADIFITATSSPGVFSIEQIQRMKNGATLCNMGENREYDAHLLPQNVKGARREQITPNLVRYHLPDNRHVDSLLDGYLLNMRTGGNGSRALGITFALHLLAQIKVSQGWRPEPGKIHRLPAGTEEQVALLNFPELEQHLTRLTSAQKEYMGLE